LESLDDGNSTVAETVVRVAGGGEADRAKSIVKFAHTRARGTVLERFRDSGA